jgi:hypothetical protein
LENDVSRHSRIPLATWLLERVLPERDREAILGDLIEEYELRARSSARWMVFRWYWGQACRSVPRIVWGSVRRDGWHPTLAVAVSAYIAAGALEFVGTVAISKLLAPAAPAYTVVSLVVGLTTMGIGGYFATWMRPGAGTVMAGIVMVVVAVLMLTTGGSAPLWYGLVFLVVGPLATLTGASLCRGRRTSAAGRAA